MQRKAWIGTVGLALLLALAGCQVPGSADVPGDMAAAAVRAGPGDPRPAPRLGSAEAAAAARTTVKAASALEPPAPARTPDAQDDLLPQAAEAAAAAEKQAAPAPVLPTELYTAPEPPPVPAILSGQAAQCTRSNGRFIQRGEGGTFVCVQPARDANRSCDDSKDCEGLCFAQSRTCAPVTPLFGCYDALENGRVVNVCTE